MKLESVMAAASGASRTRPIRPGLCKAVVLFFPLMCCAGQAWSQSSPPNDWAQEQISVRELMRLDTVLALAQAKEKLRLRDKPARAIETPGLAAQSGALKLVAIYGVGEKLLAEVHIGSTSHVYMRGRALPVGVKADPAAFRLQEITGSCVRLQRKDESHTLCLHSALWARG